MDTIAPPSEPITHTRPARPGRGLVLGGLLGALAGASALGLLIALVAGLALFSGTGIGEIATPVLFFGVPATIVAAFAGGVAGAVAGLVLGAARWESHAPAAAAVVAGVVPILFQTTQDDEVRSAAGTIVVTAVIVVVFGLIGRTAGRRFERELRGADIAPAAERATSL